MSDRTTLNTENDDFHPSDWAADLEISSGFVDSTLALVLADREQIAAEAARVDEIRMPPELLDAYRAPEPSADFAARTAALVSQARQHDWRRTLDSLTAPAPTEDFVERTLLALRIDRSSLRLLRDEAPATPSRPRLLQRSIAAAALVAAALALWFAFSDPRPGGGSPAATDVLVAEREFTPVPWSSALSDLAYESEDDLDFQPIAGLALGSLR